MYEKIEFIGGNIESAVLQLLDYKSKGILACGEFNGTALYSDTVTMDDAYLRITGKTKKEVDEAHKKLVDDYNNRKEKHRLNIPNLTKEYINKGRKILDPNKWEYWDEIVPIRLNDLYEGMELQCCLDIIELLNSEATLSRVEYELSSQDHSGMSYGLVCALVKEFSNRGQVFLDYINNTEETE